MGSKWAFRIRNRLEALLDVFKAQNEGPPADCVVRVLSYLDDITVIVPPPMAKLALEIAREELGRVGLVLNDGKTNLYAKSGKCPAGCDAWWRSATRPFVASVFRRTAPGRAHNHYRYMYI